MPDQGSTLGQKIRVLRRQMGMTQADLAGNDFTKSFISQIEKNQARPSLKSLRVFAQRLNRPVSYFLDDEPGVSETPSEAKRALSTGDLLERQGKYEEALGVYDKAISQCAQTDYAHRGQAYRQRARALQELNQLHNAIQSLLLAAEEFRLAKDAPSRAAVDRNLGELYVRLGERQKAMHHFERALLLYEEVIAPHSNAEATFPLIQLLTDLGLLAEALEPSETSRNYLQRAEALANKFNVYYRWGETCKALSRYLASTGEQSGDRQAALQYAYRAVAFFDAVLDHDGLIEALIDLGTLRFQEGGQRAAEQYFERATDVAERSQDGEAMSRVRQALASMAADAGDVERASSLYEQAISTSGNDERTLAIRRSLAELFEGRQLWDEAARHLAAIASHLEQADKPRQLIEAYDALAKVYEAGGHHEKAAQCLQRSLEVYRAAQ